MKRQHLGPLRALIPAAAAPLVALLAGAVGAVMAEPAPSATWSKFFGTPAPSASGSSSLLARPANTPAAGSVSVKGSFEWVNKPGERHELRGTLRALATGGWKAEWHFDWGRRPMSYEGTVTGDINNGPVSGTGVDAQRKRTFSFEGTARNGAWTFDCFEITGDRKPQGKGDATVQK